jgi:hypothetical protein
MIVNTIAGTLLGGNAALCFRREFSSYSSRSAHLPAEAKPRHARDGYTAYGHHSDVLVDGICDF